jgi:dihydroorotate dehydrogenase
MPDWTYQPIFRPLLHLLRPKAGRQLVLGGMGIVAWLPGGRWLIEFLGHTQPAAEMAFEKRGRRFPSRVGIGCLVDGQLLCPAALVRLGIGVLEVGPISLHPSTAPEIVRCDWEAQRIEVRQAGVRRSLADICDRVQAA